MAVANPVCAWLYHKVMIKSITCQNSEILKCTVYTPIQDDYNLSQPTKQNMSTKGKYLYLNLIQLSKTKMPVNKKYFAINFIHLIHKACQILSTFTNQCHCLYLNSQCLHIPHTHS